MNGITIADCRCVVGTFYRVPREMMMGPSKAFKVSRPRQMAMTLSREFSGASLPAIVRYFGRKDHTTVLFAMRAVAERERTSERIRGDMENFRLTLAVYQAQREATEL